MNYQSVKVLDVIQGRPNRETGEVPTYLQVEMVIQDRIKLPVNAAILNAYNQAKGQHVMIPAEYRIIEGRQFLLLLGDGMPIHIQQASKVEQVFSESSGAEQSEPAGSESLMPSFMKGRK